MSAPGIASAPVRQIALAPRALERAVPEARPPRGHEFDLRAMKRLLLAPAGPSEAGSGTAGSASTSTLLSDFRGIGRTGAIPPDPILAVGPSHVVQCVNSSFRIATKSGETLATVEFEDWWAEFTSRVPFDPWVQYDHHAGRWVMVAVARDCATGESWYLTATSFTSDPTDRWCRWALRSDWDGTVDSNSWGDYPKIGLDQNNFYFTSNQFDCDGGFSYVKVRVMNKTQFYDNACAPIEWCDFWDLRNADDTLVFSSQPALTFGNPGKQYLINSYSGFGTEVSLWSVAGTWPNPSATPPVLTLEATLAVASYCLPPDARQLDSATPVDTGDARLLNAVYRGGNLYTCHTVDADGEAAARYLRIDVTSLTVTLDALVGSPGFDYYYPAVTVDSADNVLTVVNRSSASEHIGIHYTGLRPNERTFQESAALVEGRDAYVSLDARGRNRWGDYSGIAVDPSDGRHVWGFSAFADAPEDNWGTWVGKISFVPPPPAVSVDIRIAPPRFAAGVPFRLFMNLTNEGRDFTCTLLTLFFVDGTPLIVGFIAGIPISAGLELRNIAIFSSDGLPALPQGFFLLVVLDTDTNTVIATASRTIG